MSKKLTLDQVLDAFAAAADHPSEALVSEWVGKHPEFEREIVDFAVEWAAMDMAVVDAALDAEQEDRLVARTMSHIQQVAYQLQAEGAASPEPNADGATAAQIERVEAAFRVHSRQRSLTASLGIDETVLALFEEHMILPPVPRRLLDAFSSVLGERVDAVNAWLFQDTQPAMASYAAKAPTFMRWTFQQAIENSTLPDEAKQQWLRELA